MTGLTTAKALMNGSFFPFRLSSNRHHSSRPEFWINVIIRTYKHSGSNENICNCISSAVPRNNWTALSATRKIMSAFEAESFWRHGLTLPVYPQGYRPVDPHFAYFNVFGSRDSGWSPDTSRLSYLSVSAQSWVCWGTGFNSAKRSPDPFPQNEHPPVPETRRHNELLQICYFKEHLRARRPVAWNPLTPNHCRLIIGGWHRDLLCDESLVLPWCEWWPCVG